MNYSSFQSNLEDFKYNTSSFRVDKEEDEGRRSNEDDKYCGRSKTKRNKKTNLDQEE